ncbi:MAG: MerR family DNA-binding transcriptional regulator, partial [Patescibacteria group bacterium]
MDLPAQKETKRNTNDYNDFHKSSYLRVSQASKVLNISPSTLRRYEDEGKISSERLPNNNYRVYKLSDINSLKHKLQDTSITKSVVLEKRKIKKLSSQKTITLPVYTPNKFRPTELEKVVRESIKRDFKLPKINFAP